LALAWAGCENDRIEPGDNWRLDAGSDGNLMEVGGPDADGGSSDGGPSEDDGGPVDDGGVDGGDTDPRLPPEYSPDPAIPSQPSSTTVCNDNQWCWLHPAPLPHAIDNLRTVDGRVYATAEDGAVRGWQPMVWDETGFELLDKPVPPNQEVVDMTTTVDGWLALTPGGTLYDIGPDGVRDSVTLEGDAYKGILGVSFEAYLAWESDRDAILRRDGQSLTYNELPSLPTDTAMWDDGTLWGLGELRDEKREFLNGDWTAYPEPSGFFGEELSALGPSPYSACASSGLWSASESGFSYRWDGMEGIWRDIDHAGGQVQSFGCAADGGLAAVDDTGLLLRWENETWNAESVSRLPLNDFAAADGQTYTAGPYGTMAVATGSTLDHAGGGFRLPPSESPSYYGTGYLDIWTSADGETMVLAHPSGLYMGTEQGWSKMPAPPDTGSGATSDDRVDIWGLNEPLFAMIGNRLLRWNGSRWTPAVLPGAATSDGAAIDLAGINPSEVWMASESGLNFFDGSSWSNISEPGSSVGGFIDNRDLTLSALDIGQNGTVIVAASGALYELTGAPGNWQIRERTSTPCQEIRDVAVTEAATFVAGFSGCVARKRQGSWTEYELPAESNWPPTVFAPKAYELAPNGEGFPTLVATSVGLIGLHQDGTTGIQYVGDFRDLSVSARKSAILALHRSGVVARYFD
jgi:hypothetical protein